MDILIFSLLSASIILLSSIGFSMILKAEGFLNIAHGQMLLLGAYAGLFFNNIGLNIVMSAALASVACGVFGVLGFRYLFLPLKKRGALVMLFTSVGLAYVINGLVGAVAGKRMLAYDLPPVRAMQIAGQPFMTIYELSIVVIAVLSALIVHVFLSYTWAGKGVRAVSDNSDLARVRGIDPRRTSDTVWFAASALAGLAGVFLGILGSLHLQMGWQQIIIVLATTVLGGLGSVYGVMLAAFVLALGIELGLLVVPSNYRSGLAFLLIIVVMLIKPEGLQALWGGGRSRNH
ncbi:branched-chain amino acid ABC transporter permease [Ensifer adhaerens]|uniref:branched-chain amino acid ABC transporter permease n=1 Tax=Ensifer adhaerens TaxID=106592 RepID=UPI001CC02E87|nr:branched-chain amino acid ABC transporter permease [Ensifer adhaerens]MBZ7927750.1 branched-chain amino acid ABC transporter permease [Ensifer adhaerens]UAX96610.1 branched-chain amino acid ABC transporter permease [Ensifer adhaerens]UAY04046.1 branched-chain amino acid ABC transporter permease [Ensifer adhaerens]UAY12032.1 branched-chain amino acid ABC transporter permease [Ensifer adhaerens]